MIKIEELFQKEIISHYQYMMGSIYYKYFPSLQICSTRILFSSIVLYYSFSSKDEMENILYIIMICIIAVNEFFSIVYRTKCLESFKN